MSTVAELKEFNIEQAGQILESSLGQNDKPIYKRGSLRRMWLDYISICQQLVLGRKREIVLTTAALLTNNHVMFYGAPGEGKSYLANTMLENIVGEGVEFYKTFLFADMEVDQILGSPIADEYLKGNYIRRIEKKLPNATFAFLDEFGKAPSSLKGVLFPLLNERIFPNGDENVQTPLKSCIAATNEADDELAGLYSRFLLKLNFTRPTNDVRMDILMRRANAHRDGKPIFNEEYQIDFGAMLATQDDVHTVEFPEHLLATLLSFADQVETRINVDTRKLESCITFLKALAWLEAGRERCVSSSHFSCLPNLFADNPEDIDFLTEKLNQYSRSSLLL